MRTIYDLRHLYEDQLGTDLMERLAALYPEGVARTLRGSRSFSFKLEDTDPRARAVLALLGQHGYEPDLRLGRMPPPKRLAINVERTYDDADLEGCEFAEVCDCFPAFGAMRPEEDAPALDSPPRSGPPILTDLLPARYDEAGEVVDIDPAEAEAMDLSSLPFGMAEGGNWLVSDRFRRAMDGLYLAHAVLTPTILVGRAAARSAEPLWELTTDLLTPPLSPSLLRLDIGGNVLEDTEGPYESLRASLTFPDTLGSVELRYTRASLEALGPFDLAASREQARRFPPGVLPEPRVVSARFYRLCREFDLPFRWCPVRVED